MPSAAVALCCLVSCGGAAQVGTLVIKGDTISMRQRPAGAAASSPRSPQIMVLGLDGVSRDPFNAVLAYGGAMGFVYLADRSTCAGDRACAWATPPRYREDVLAVAEGFFTNNTDGALAPGMKGALDMIFVRVPKPAAEIDLPFEVYVGGGKTMSIESYLAAHPHPTYVALAARMRELAVGLHGERAGDILLLAHNGDRDKAEDRFYFAAPYRSWHGSPSRQDSEIPLIVANPDHDAGGVAAIVGKVLGDAPYQRKINDLLLELRDRPAN